MNSVLSCDNVAVKITNVVTESEASLGGCRVLWFQSFPKFRKEVQAIEKLSLQYSGLENSVDSIVQGVAKSWTQLSNFHFSPFH